jgi:hypothetical protein
MGNLQCGAPSPTYDEEFDLDILPSSSSSPKTARLCFIHSNDVENEDVEHEHESSFLDEADEEGEQRRSPGRGSSQFPFLRVHRKDRHTKVLLDQNEVTQAFVEQVEELIRRDDNGMEDILGASSITEMAANSHINDEEEVVSQFTNFSSVAPSALAPTEVTTMSCATRPTGNARHPSRKTSKRKSKDEGTPPKLKGGNNFTASEILRREILNAMSANERRPRLSLTFSGSGRTITLPDEQACTCLNPCMAADEWEPMRNKQVQQHMAVLHLRMTLKCSMYDENNFSGNLPAFAFSEGITRTNLSPSRKKNRHKCETMPGLDTSFSSSASSSDNVKFGAGPPSSPVKLLVTDSAFMDLAVTGSLGLVDRNRSKKRVVSVVDRKQQLKSPDHYLVLLNRRSGIPLAVCALKATTNNNGPPVVRMFATKRRVFGQRPAASTLELGLNWSHSLPLYTWAEIVTEGRYPNPVRYSIYMASGSDGRFEDTPSYRGVHDSSCSREVRVVGRTEREEAHSGCAILAVCADKDAAGEEDVFFRLSISRGVDPALIICFAAFVNENMENTLRLQCQPLSESVYQDNAGILYSPASRDDGPTCTNS